MTDRIEHERRYDAAPATLYELLTSGARFGEMTGAPAEIDGAAGAEFSCFGGAIHGRNIECAPGARLVQAWRVGSWDDGLYSIVRFELTPEGDGTKLLLQHSGFPADQREHLAQGWVERYLDPLTEAVG